MAIPLIGIVQTCRRKNPRFDLLDIFISKISCSLYMIKSILFQLCI